MGFYTKYGHFLILSQKLDIFGHMKYRTGTVLSLGSVNVEYKYCELKYLQIN